MIALDLPPMDSLHLYLRAVLSSALDAPRADPQQSGRAPSPRSGDGPRPTSGTGWPDPSLEVVGSTGHGSRPTIAPAGSAADQTGPVVDVRWPATELLGPVTALRAARWAAWVLAALPEETDPVLATAALLHVQGLAPTVNPPDPLVVTFADDDACQPDPARMWEAAVLGLGRGWSALVLLAAPAPAAAQLTELTEVCRHAAPGIRRNLPGSLAWSVAALPEPTRALYQRAARIADRALAARVEVGHVAAALLLEDDLESAEPPEGPVPDPADGTLDLLTDPAGHLVPDAVLRARVVRTLAGATLVAGSSTTSVGGPQRDAGGGFLAAVRSGAVAGVTLISPEAAAGAPANQPTGASATGDGPTSASADPRPAATGRQAPTPGASGSSAPGATGSGTPGAAWRGTPEVEAAAVEVAVQLGRRDTRAVWLAGSRAEHAAVLARLATLGALGQVPLLADRHLICIDPTAVTPAAEERLATDLTYRAPQLVAAIAQTATRLGAQLVRTTAAAGVPTILLGHPLQPPPADVGSPPLVNAGGPKPAEPRPAKPPVTDLLAPIATELASAHRVTLAAGVLQAAAAPPPDVPPTSRDRTEARLPDGRPTDDLPNGPRPDPIALGRARLDYACSRAAMRPDRQVTTADVPLDPSRGLTAGATPAADPSTRFADLLAADIVDQPQAVHAIAERLTFAARGLRRTGPRTALLLAGPPGTGKTHTAAAVAATYYRDPTAVIRVDCGALFDRHTISTLLGAPPAYVGYDDTERLLTTQITSRHGRCVVLFDEIEKADRGVLDILLGVLDSGQLVDLQQRTADASHAVFLLTSNLGSEQFSRRAAGFTPASTTQTEAAVRAEIRSHLRPELLDRIDDIVVYRPLTHAGITELTARHLATLTAELATAGYQVQIGPAILAHLADHVRAIGVRGLRRHVETTLLRDLFHRPAGHYRADLEGGTLVWRGAAQQAPGP